MGVQLAANGDFYSFANSASFSLPATAWVVACFGRLTTDTTGANLRIMFTNGASGAPRITAGIAGPGGTVPGAMQATTEFTAGNFSTPRGAVQRGADNVDRWMLIVFDPIRSREGVSIYSVRTNGVVRLEGSASLPAGLPGSIVPTSGMRVGAATSGGTSANNWIGYIYQFFIYKGRLTDLEMSMLGQGKDITTDLGKACSVLIDFTTAAATLTDRSGNGNTATLNGTPTTVGGPTYSTTAVSIGDQFDRKVYQYEKGKTTKDLPILVAYSGSPALIEARAVIHGTSTPVLDWTPVSTSPAAGGNGNVLALTLPNVPRGDIAGGKGWYNIQIRATGAAEVTDAPAKAKLGVGEVVLCIGQSPMDRSFNITSGSNPAVSDYGTVGGQTPAYDGIIAMVNGFLSRGNWPVMYINCAVGGTFLLTSLDTGTGNWQATGANDLYTISVEKLNFLANGDCANVKIDQGEADGTSTTPILFDATVAGQYGAALIALAGRYRTVTGRTTDQMKFIISGTGAASSGKAGISATLSLLRAKQYEVGTTQAGMLYAGSSIDFPLNDTIHNAAFAYKSRGRRRAQAMLYGLGVVPELPYGPKLLGMSYIGKKATVTVQHQGGSALTMRNPNFAPPPGAVFSDDSGALALAAGGFVLSGASSMQFTFTRAIVGTLTLSYDLLNGGSAYTPLSDSVAPITTVNASNDVQITLAGHGRIVGDLINIASIAATGNAVPQTVAGQYVGDLQTVSSVVDANNLKITLATAASSSATGGLTPILGLRFVNDVMDNSTPAGDTIGRPLIPGTLTAVAAGTIAYDSWAQFVPKGTATQIASAGLS